jgi:hypothetical protein
LTLKFYRAAGNCPADCFQRCQALIAKQAKAGKPFFVCMNITHMRAFIHLRSMKGQSGMPGNDYADGTVEHDGDVGKLLKTLDDLNIADNTFVVYSIGSGTNQFSWPDASSHRCSEILEQTNNPSCPPFLAVYLARCLIDKAPSEDPKTMFVFA